MRRGLRWLVPVAVTGAVVGGVQLTAWAANAAPSLPEISARDLLVKAQSAQVDALSGTVRSTTHLGLPELPSMGGTNWSSLASGTQTLRVFADGPTRQRVDLLGDLAQASVVHDGRTVWTWDSQTREVTRATLPAAAMRPLDGPRLPQRLADRLPTTPQQAADQALAAIGSSTDVSVGRAASVAGRDAYDLTLRPRDAASLIGSVQVFVDARTGMALRAVVTPRGRTEPAVDVGFTSLRLHAPSAATFRFVTPPGSTVKDVAVPAPPAGDHRAQPSTPDRSSDRPDVRVIGSGWTAVLAARTPATGPVPDRSGGQGAGPDDVTGSLGGALLAASRPVSGEFGTGRLLTTRLLTVLRTDDGRVYAGAVTPAELLRVAGSDSAAR